MIPTESALSINVSTAYVEPPIAVPTTVLVKPSYSTVTTPDLAPTVAPIPAFALPVGSPSNITSIYSNCCLHLWLGATHLVFEQANLIYINP
mmetsp:Transcript_29306/g.70712  ORF Transcript_29306/g.70712 Transcript_29306/m.70712 type:complete len:92 (+) Transcript_29306:2166-2441(+)